MNLFINSLVKTLMKILFKISLMKKKNKDINKS